MFIAYETLEHLSPDQTGMFAGIWVAGDFVFLAIVIVVSMKILVASNLINGGEIFWIVLSFLGYVASYGPLSGVFVSSDQYGTMYMLFA